MLDTRRLRVLCAVAQHGSFSAAATALGYTQPAISRQVATLEAETATVLMRRVPAGIVLTDAGRLLVTRAEAILARLDDAETELAALHGLQGGTLRLATFASAAASVLPIAVARFRERYPAVELEIAMADPDTSMPGLRAGRFDLVLSHDAMWEVSAPGADCELVALFEDPMYVAMAATHPLAGARRLSLTDFSGEPWMLATTQSCPDSRLFLRSCHAAGFEPRIAFQNDDYSAILGFVAAGVGVAMIPDMVARSGRDDVRIRALEPPPPPRPISAVLPARYRSPAAAAMLAVLHEVGEEWVREAGATLSPVGV
ncbi:MAG TPA: LysR substrate-binding domain-containing protein [Solirubrobacteraceae bacterium]|nr:LysR substrate-binding domain-containing protein [Solirubrobacteraceae bacterium]